MDPQSEFLKLGSIEPRVDLKPVWSDEASGDEDNHNTTQTQGDFPSEGPLPVGIGVWQEVVSHSHGDTLTLTGQCLFPSEMRHFHKMVEVSLECGRGGPVSWVGGCQVNISTTELAGAAGGEFEIFPNSPHGSPPVQLHYQFRNTEATVGNISTQLFFG